MRKAEGAAARHADLLGQVTQDAYAGVNAGLEQLARRPGPAIDAAGQADFFYLDGAAPATIPAASFHRRYVWCLQTLEVTVYGYCAPRLAGWERRLELDFSMRRPPWWRRLLRRAPLLALEVLVGHGGVRVRVVPAPPNAAAPRSAYLFRLPPELQRQLAVLHTARPAAPALKTRLRVWLGSLNKY